MGNEDYGPPPSGEPIGHGALPPSSYPPGSYPPHAYPPNAYPPGSYPAPTPSMAVFPAAYPAAYPPGLPVARTDRNWMGIASLVLGLLGGGLLGLGFGIGGIMAANEGRATNRKMSIWGVVLNTTLPIILFIAAVSAGVLSDAFSTDRVDYNQLAVGDCVQEPSGWNDAGSDLDAVGIERVSCDEIHWGEVYFEAILPGTVYPGDDEIVVLSEDVCFSDAAALNVSPEHVDEAFVYYIMPTDEAWLDGDREVTCFLSNEDHSLAESWTVEP